MHIIKALSQYKTKCTWQERRNRGEVRRQLLDFGLWYVGAKREDQKRANTGNVHSMANMIRKNLWRSSDMEVLVTKNSAFSNFSVNLSWRTEVLHALSPGGLTHLDQNCYFPEEVGICTDGGCDCIAVSFVPFLTRTAHAMNYSKNRQSFDLPVDTLLLQIYFVHALQRIMQNSQSNCET